MTRARWALLICFLAASCLCLWAQEPPALEIDALSADALAEYDETTGVITDPAGVRVQYGDTVLTAKSIRLDPESATVEAQTEVRLQRGKELWIGERLRYNFATREIDTGTFRMGVTPFFAAGEGLHADFTNQTHSANRAFLTTDDVVAPAYRVQARKLVFVPGRCLQADRAVLYLGRVPVFYLPCYRRHLDRQPSYFSVLPGYRSKYGAFALSTYNWAAATNINVPLHLDYRVKRGLAGGLDLQYQLGSWGEGHFGSYFLHDNEPGNDLVLTNRAIDPDRYRISFLHSAFPRTNLSVKVVLDKQSDAYVAHDFFESSYRRDAQPKSFAEIVQLWPNFSLNLLAQPQIDDFFQTVERLPDVKLTSFRQPLGISPFYYESESSASYLRMQPGDYYAATNYSALRADTFHQLLVPQTLFGWLNVTPRAGGRFTYYGEERGAGRSVADQRRWVFNTGAEVSTKASRVWRQPNSSLFELHELRHIIEPSVNYVYVPEPSLRPRRLPQFDYEFYSHDLLPVDFPDYNAIDSIDSQNVIRFGLRNKLQTKRAAGIDDLLNWALVMDWRLRPREDQRTFSDLYSDLSFKPRSWLTLQSETRFDINDELLRLASATATLLPNDRWSWKLGYRYVREDAALGLNAGQNLFLSSFFLRLNENWGLRLRHHYDLADQVMQEQFYTLYRDFRSYTAALTFRLRENSTRTGETDFTVALVMSLKAFPRLKLGQDRDEPERLLGR